MKSMVKYYSLKVSSRLLRRNNDCETLSRIHNSSYYFSFPWLSWT